MGHSRAEKTETHKRIVEIASKRLREEGLAGLGVADLMKEAGLTVGGFYKHFDSRDALVREAISAAFGSLRGRVAEAAAGGPPVAFTDVIDDYLTTNHRDHPGEGCAICATAAEAARGDARLRARYTDEIRTNIELTAALIAARADNADRAGKTGKTGKTAKGRRDRRAARARAILTFAALVGAVTLSRTVSDENLSREILKSAREQLKA